MIAHHRRTYQPDPNTQVKAFFESGAEELAAQLKPETLNDEQRTVDIVWFTSIDVSRYDWMSGQTYLRRFDPKGADLSLLNNGAPVCDNHLMSQVADQMGVVEKAWIDGKNYMARVRFSKRPEVDGLWQDIKDKIVTKFSMGVEILKSEDQARKNSDPLVKLATEWRPFEISVAPIPADFGTTTLAREENMQTQTPDEKQIRDRVKSAKLPDTFAATLIGQNLSSGDVASRIVDELAKNDPFPQSLNYPSGAGVCTRDHGDGLASAMGEALACRYTGKAPSDRARQYMGASILDLARECLRASGRNAPTWLSGETIRLAHTTSDFPALLTETGRRMLLNSYETSQPAILQVARRSTSSDYRAKAALRLGEAPKLLKVNESGEIEHGTRAESKESYRLATYARIFSISRQALINDDLSAFSDFVSAFGVAAATLQGELLTALLVSNPTMDDNTALFHADHANVTTGGGSALGAAGLSGARKAMRQTKGMDGTTILDIQPRYLVVPSALETTAEQLLATIYAATVEDVNPFSGKLALVVDPRLDATSIANWYLFADPSRVPVLEYSFLEGHEGPQIEQRDGWNTLGTEFRCFLDFGAGAIDFRGAHRAAGS